MRIDRLDLMAYGHFTKRSLDLSNGDAGLHLIYGNNEAGKSTSLRALIALLFGIPKSTNDSYLYSYTQLRIGGKLRLSGGKEIDFVRRKGAAKGTLLKPDTDMAMDDAALSPFLPGGINETLFTKLYGIDHTRLVTGGQELLNQSGDIGQALFSAAVGTENLRKVLLDLQSRAEELFMPQASKKLVNQAIFSFKSAQKQVRDSSLSVGEWQKLKKEREEILSSVSQVEESINEKSKEKSRLNRVNRVKGALAERRNVVAQIEAMGDVLLLPEEFDEKRKTASGNLQKASEDRARCEAKVSRLKEESESLNVHNELIDNEQAIVAIQNELAVAEQASKDRPQQDGKRRQLRGEAENLLKAVRPDIALDHADSLRPLLNNKRRVSSLAQEKSLLTQKKEMAEATLRDSQDKQESIKKELGKLSESNLDLSELNAAIAEARKADDLEQQLSDAQKRVSDTKTVCENGLAKLGRFSGTIEVLLKVAMPVSETLDIFEKKFDELSEKIRDYGHKQKDLNEEQKQAEQELNALLLTSDVPTIAELEEARTIRNRGWNLIKRKYIENNDVEQDIKKFEPDSDLPAFYEQKVESADHVSDRLRLDADQVAKRASLEAKIEVLKSRVSNIREKIGKANEAHEINQKEWNIIWEALGIYPGTPKEMKQWLPRVEKLLENIQTANMASREANNLIEKYKKTKKSLSFQISRFNDTIDLQEIGLEAMINLCERRVQQEESILQGRRQLEYSLHETELHIKRTCEELKSIGNNQSIWIQTWSQAIDGLGLQSDVHPEIATETFEQLKACFDNLDKSEEHNKRIYGMDRVIEKFEKRVFEFADSIRFKRDGQTANTIAAQLNLNLNEAREDRASLKKITTQETEVKEEIKDADITIQAAQEQLTVLRSQARVGADSALESAGESSRKMHKLRERLHTFEQALAHSGEGLNIQQLEQEASALDVDAIEGALTKVSTELTDLQVYRDTLRDKLQTLQNAIKTKDGSAAAATASEEEEQHLAAIISGTEQHLRLKIAALILQQQIEDYRKVNQAPVLARAGALFSKLTLGSYATLRDELDENGRPILLGVRRDNKEVPVIGMSDGTRDQLYLSLRLATLEQHLGKGEPMPFIVDDILIGFDDDRTKVCLDALSELAGRTQVLLFTHHKRVIELASGLEAKAGIFIHELG